MVIRLIFFVKIAIGIVFISCSASSSSVNEKDIPISFSAVNTSFTESLSDSIFIKCKNMSDHSVQLSHPSRYANTLIYLLSDDGNVLDPKIKIKPNLSHRKWMQELLPGDSLFFAYDYTLSDLFLIEKQKKYRLQFKYIGDILVEEKKINTKGIMFENIIRME